MDNFFRDYLTVKTEHFLKQERVYEEFKFYRPNCEFGTVRELLVISRDRESIVRRYFILDTIANYGQPIPADSTAGYLTVPGYSTYWGLFQADVIKRALEIAPMLHSLWRSHLEPFDDIQWLLEKGFVKAK